MSSFSLLTPPATEPVSVAEAKAHARIDTDADDALVANLITAARQWAEAYAGRAFITQTWKLALDGPPSERAIALPRAPLQSIVSVQTFDDADAGSTWEAANYFVDSLSEPGRLVLRAGACWPFPTREANGLVVTYTCGFGDSAENVPEPIKAAIKELVAAWYEDRGDETARKAASNAEALLAPFRVRMGV